MADNRERQQDAAHGDITVKGVRVHNLKNLDLRLPRRKLVVVTGPSGSGKSTFLRCLNGLETFNSGHIEIDGMDLADRKTDLNKVRAEVGMVFQSYALFPHLTVRENILFGLKVRGTAKENRRARLAEAAKMVGLTDLLDRSDLPTASDVLGPHLTPVSPHSSEPSDDRASDAARALVRCRLADGLALSRALREAAGVRSARREPGSVRIRIDPVDLQ